MEITKLANIMMKPADALIDIPVRISRFMGIYPVIRNGVYSLVKSSMKIQYSILNGLEVEGLENIPADGGALLAFNHQSWLDAQVVTAVMPRKIHFIAKSELFDWPVIRFVIDLADSLKIERGGDANGIKSVVDALRSGELVGIFPEGTIPGEEDIPRSAVRPETGLLVGHTGVVRMAATAGVPIIPVGLSGTGKTFPPEMYPRLEELPLAKIGVPITVRIGKPVDYESVLIRLDDEKFDYRSLKLATCKVMRAISRLVDHERNFEPLEVTVPDDNTDCSESEAGLKQE